MWVHWSGPAEAQERVGQQSGGDAREQADEGPGAMPRQSQAVGEFTDGGLDAIAQGGDGAADRRRGGGAGKSRRQSRWTSANQARSLGRASRCRTRANVSTSASEQAGAGPGRRGIGTCP